jgi:hypothetical protein
METVDLLDRSCGSQNRDSDRVHEIVQREAYRITISTFVAVMINLIPVASSMVHDVSSVEHPMPWRRRDRPNNISIAAFKTETSEKNREPL